MSRSTRPTDRGRIKDEFVRLRANRTRKELWRAGAQEEGMGLSEWLRFLADQRLAELTSGPER